MNDIEDFIARIINEFDKQKVIKAIKSKQFYFNKWKNFSDSKVSYCYRDTSNFIKNIFGYHCIIRILRDHQSKKYLIYFTEDNSTYACANFIENKTFLRKKDAKSEVDNFLLSIGFGDFDGRLVLFDFHKI